MRSRPEGAAAVQCHPVAVAAVHFRLEEVAEVVVEFRHPVAAGAAEAAAEAVNHHPVAAPAPDPASHPRHHSLLPSWRRSIEQTRPDRTRSEPRHRFPTNPVLTPTFHPD